MPGRESDAGKLSFASPFLYGLQINEPQDLMSSEKPAQTRLSVSSYAGVLVPGTRGKRVGMGKGLPGQGARAQSLPGLKIDPASKPPIWEEGYWEDIALNNYQCCGTNWDSKE